jgi:hypothetical protein
VQQHDNKLDNKWPVPLYISKIISALEVHLAYTDTGIIVKEAPVSQLKKYSSVAGQLISF